MFTDEDLAKILSMHSPSATVTMNDEGNLVVTETVTETKRVAVIPDLQEVADVLFENDALRDLVWEAVREHRKSTK